MAWLLFMLMVILVYLPVGAFLMGRVEGRQYNKGVDDIAIWFWPVFLALMLGGKLFAWCWDKGARRR